MVVGLAWLARLVKLNRWTMICVKLYNDIFSTEVGCACGYTLWIHLIYNGITQMCRLAEQENRLD